MIRDDIYLGLIFKRYSCIKFEALPRNNASGTKIPRVSTAGSNEEIYQLYCLNIDLRNFSVGLNK